MTKYNQSFKQQVIEFYLQHDKNRSFTRQHFQLAETTLKRWIQQYNYNGMFKLAVVQAVKNRQFSAGYARLYFSIPHSGIISKWLQAFDKKV